MDREGGEEAEAIDSGFGAGLGDGGGRDERERLSAFITEITGILRTLIKGDRRSRGRFEHRAKVDEGFGISGITGAKPFGLFYGRDMPFRKVHLLILSRYFSCTKRIRDMIGRGEFLPLHQRKAGETDRSGIDSISIDNQMPLYESRQRRERDRRERERVIEIDMDSIIRISSPYSTAGKEQTDGLGLVAKDTLGRCESTLGRLEDKLVLHPSGEGKNGLLLQRS